MKTIHIEVEGVTALLMHNPSGMRPVEKAIGRKTIPTPEDEAEAGCYRLPSGQFYLPTFAFRACLVSGAKNMRLGKTAATAVIKGSVFPATETTALWSPTGDPLEKFEIDMRRAMVQRQGIVRCRPKLAEWAASVEFEYDDDFVAEDHIREFLSIGGRVCGVGDYRPEKSGPFGRFKLR